MAIKDPELDAEEQPLHWRRLLQEEEAEQLAERKRLLYVAATRAEGSADRLRTLSGQARSKSTGAALLDALGVTDLADGDRVRYTGRAGITYECRVRGTPIGTGTVPDGVAAAGAAGAASVAALPPFVPREIPDTAPPIDVPRRWMRHSATELMAHDRCPRRHWFRYVAGLPEPPADDVGPRAEPGTGGAPMRGQIVHDVLQRLAADADADAAADRDADRDALLDAADRPVGSRGRGSGRDWRLPGLWRGGGWAPRPAGRRDRRGGAAPGLPGGRGPADRAPRAAFFAHPR